MTTAAASVIIVGAGPGGLSVARAYREHGGAGTVTMVGAESLLPYSRPPLTKEFLRGEIEPEGLGIEPVEWFEEQRVTLRLGETVTAIDAQAGAVHVGEDVLSAQVIVLATGSEPVRPHIPGIADPSVITIRELADSKSLRDGVQTATRVAVIGSGFIGCETAASLAMRGASVTLIGQGPLPQQLRLGEAVASRLSDWLSELGVKLRMGAGVESLPDAKTIQLTNGDVISVDLVVLGTGSKPRSELARAAGLELVDGGVRTDEQMRASEHVMAVGDVARAFNLSANRRLRVEHWGDALDQGQIAGTVLAGDDASWAAVPGFWSTIGDRTLKYAAWGDGFETSRMEDHAGGGFSVWYYSGGELVGVLTHECDGDYESGSQAIRSHQG